MDKKEKRDFINNMCDAAYDMRREINCKLYRSGDEDNGFTVDPDDTTSINRIIRIFILGDVQNVGK